MWGNRLEYHFSRKQGYFSRSTHISSKITIDLVNPADLTSLSLVFLF